VIAATSRTDDRRFDDCAELFLLRYFLLSSLVIDFLDTCMVSFLWMKKLVVIEEDVQLIGLDWIRLTVNEIEKSLSIGRHQDAHETRSSCF
jgi:hypothetical protein